MKPAKAFAYSSTRYLVTRNDGTHAQSEIWDGTGELHFGKPARWALRRRFDGKAGVVFLPRGETLQGGAEPKPIDEADLERPVPVSLADCPGELTIRMLPPLRAVYIPRDEEENAKVAAVGKLPLLLAFAGTGRSVISCRAVASGYVAYSRKNPVFVLERDQDAFIIKPLLAGTRLKLKGQNPIPGNPGEEWRVDERRLSQATVLRGNHWWRFGFADAPPILTDDVVDVEALHDSKWRKRVGLALLVCLTLLTISSLFKPLTPVKPVEEVEEKPPVVRLVKPKYRHALQAAPETISRKEVQALEDKVRAEKAQVKKPEHKADAPSPKVADSANKSPSPAKANAKNANSARTQAASSQAPKSNRAALAQAMALGKVLNAAKHLAGKNPLPLPSGSSAGRAASLVGGGGSSVSLSPTTARPGELKQSFAVSTVGGGAADGETGSVGYGSGEREAGSGVRGGGLVASGASGKSGPMLGLTREEIGSVIHSHMSEVRYCYESAVLSKPELEGKVNVKFVIEPSGAVRLANVANSSTANKAIDECLIRKLKAWRFPQPRGGIDVNVTYPFVFKTLGRETASQ